MQKKLNTQLNAELYSSGLYLSMSSYLHEQNLDGFAHFFKMQAMEEYQHALKQFDYLHRVEGILTVTPIPQPKRDFKNLQDVFEYTLEHEKKVTRDINEIVSQALKEGDFATHTFMLWFINEQVEEMDVIKSYLQKLRMIGDNQSALYLLNESLGKRPAPFAAAPSSDPTA